MGLEPLTMDTILRKALTSGVYPKRLKSGAFSLDPNSTRDDSLTKGTDQVRCCRFKEFVRLDR
eukprot:scaffold153_cov347-Pavlova_lutheri.AAC.52